MKLGLQVSNFTGDPGPAQIGASFAEIARVADQAGLESLWVMDHLFQIRGIGPPEWEMLEGYSLLNFAAGITSQIKLGTMVTAVFYRYPGVLAKMVTTLDVLSGGRAYLGLGAGWNEDESRSLGIPFPPLKQRFEMLEETLQICLQMWAGDETPFNGTQYQLARPLNVPQSISRPHPRILVGGGGEKKTLRMVAQYADACNLFAGPAFTQKLAVLREHCDRLGRDISTIDITALFPLEDVARTVRTPKR